MHQGHVPNVTPSEDVAAPVLSWGTPLLFLALTLGTAQISSQLHAEASWREVCGARERLLFFNLDLRRWNRRF